MSEELGSENKNRSRIFTALDFEFEDKRILGLVRANESAPVIALARSIPEPLDSLGILFGYWEEDERSFGIIGLSLEGPPDVLTQPYTVQFATYKLMTMLRDLGLGDAMFTKAFYRAGEGGINRHSDIYPEDLTMEARLAAQDLMSFATIRPEDIAPPLG